MRVLIVGGGWAGLSAAVHASRQGWQVTLKEASRQLGGRARALDHQGLRLDNGQHILIGAYAETLELMRTVGLDPRVLLHRETLTLRRPDGSGLQLPSLPAPWNLLVGVLRARGWTWRDRLSLLRLASNWQRNHFQCEASLSVSDLCQGVTPHVMHQLIEPLCVSALNTPPAQASAAVFLRVLRDALWSGPGGSDLLLPRVDLSALLPDAAQRWLVAHGVDVQCGQRWMPGDSSAQDEADVDAIILACPAWDAARLTSQRYPRWSATARDLPHTAIATVYVRAARTRTADWPCPMMALPSDDQHPAQFVFNRGPWMVEAGSEVLACVVSASEGTRTDIESRVIAQLRMQLSQHISDITPLLTVVEKRATFACTPGLQRPPHAIGPGWWACGDYVQGPYPATLEGAVRSGREVIEQIAQARQAEGRR